MKLFSRVNKVEKTFELPGDVSAAAIELMAGELGIHPKGLEYLLQYGAQRAVNDAVGSKDLSDKDVIELAEKRLAAIVNGTISAGHRGPSVDPMEKAMVAIAVNSLSGRNRTKDSVAKAIAAHGLAAAISGHVAALLAAKAGVAVSAIPADGIEAAAKTFAERIAIKARALVAASAPIDME